MASVLSRLLPIRRILRAVGATFVEMEPRPALAFTGDAVTVTDDPTYVDPRGVLVGKTLVTIAGSGYDVVAGATQAVIEAAIAAAVSAGRPCLFGPGVIELDDPIALVAGARIKGAGHGLTTIQPSASWTGTGADARANALFYFDPGLGTTTTLTANAPERSLAIPVDDESGFSAADYFYIRGNNPQIDDALDFSDGTSIELQELCRVASTATGAIVLAWPLRQQHADTLTVQRLTSVLTDAGIEDVTLAGEEDAACGISLDSSLGFELRDVGMSGFTRAGLDVVGDFGTKVGTVHDKGGNNCLVYSESSIDGVFGNGLWTYDPQGTRYASTGTTRAKMTFSRRPTNIIIDPGTLGRGCYSLRKSGGNHVSVRHYMSIDMDPTEVIARTADDGMTTVVGTAWHGGMDVLGYEEFALDIVMEGFTASNHRHPDTGTSVVVPTNCPVTAYFHDEKIILDGKVSIFNQGANVGSTIEGVDNYRQYGIFIKDAKIHGGNIEIRGCEYAVQTGNYYAECSSEVTIHGGAESGANAGPVFYLDHGNLGGPRFRRLRVDSVIGVFRFGPGFVLTEGDVIAEEYIVEGYRYGGPIMLASVAADSTYGLGDIAEIDPTSTVGARKLRLYTGEGSPVVICGGNPGGDFASNTVIPFMPLPGSFATVNATSAEVLHGDAIVGAAATKTCAASSAKDVQVIGRALTGKAAGSAGLITIGPASIGGPYLRNVPATTTAGTPNLITSFGSSYSQLSHRLGTSAYAWWYDSGGASQIVAASTILLDTVTACLYRVGSNGYHARRWADSGWVAEHRNDHKRIAIADDDTWTDATNGTTATVTITSGETQRIRARVVMRDTVTGAAPGTHSRTITLDATVQNLAGTVTIDEDPGVVAGTAVEGSTPSAQIVVVAGVGVKAQVKASVDASNAHAIQVEVYVDQWGVK